MLNNLRYINHTREYFKKNKVGLRANNSFLNNYNRGNIMPVKSWSYKPTQEGEDKMGDLYVKSFQEICYNSDSDDSKDKKDVKRCGVIMITEGDFGTLKLLVVRGRDGHIWSLPKGRINEDETDEECATRELYEETGVKIQKLDEMTKCKMGKNYYYVVKAREEDYTNFFIHDKNEVDKVEWKSIEELKEVKCNKDIRSILLFPEKKYLYHQIIFG
jgi:bis(5'-nucleosidyl)-tetraphosphatase